ncbi:ScbA/BarX family gamma-butyrolactone biosynthesis protein [Streptomyces sp. NPDC051217]|uniref:ScbA/BarX family gamma-butyrolactone biosynthesis protein n=1 Tax=Streptomyces sp. NPDC051217 TaxID=3365644 RepID=UPI0037974C1C
MIQAQLASTEAVQADQATVLTETGTHLSMAAEEQTVKVAKEWVHRSEAADVLPTGWTRLADNRFSITARWPLAHRSFTPVGGAHHDPVLIAETMRQATMLLAHAEFGVPVGDHFVMGEMRYTAELPGLALGSCPADIDMDVICSEIRRRGQGLRSMRVAYTLSRGGRVFATGGGHIHCTSASAYRRLRGEHMAAVGRPVPLLPGIPPQEVSRASPDDVVLSAGDRPGNWLLRVDTTHPALFGRPNDHIPGMLLVEAVRQAAAAVTRTGPMLLTGLDMRYTRYAELDRPCVIEAEVIPSDDRATAGVRVTGSQDGHPVFEGTVSAPRARAKVFIPRPRSSSGPR